jgi:predicted dehydrogenase/threonine dehydrogenase-like Zn-dependent dehydrogenase
MKQVFQDISGGATLVTEVPLPRCGPGQILIRSTRSLISAGTERSLVDFGRAGYLEKARQQPDKVKMVLDKVRTDGLAATVSAVKSKLAQPMAMGYSNVGVVVEVGKGVVDLKPGDRVLSNGSHAEYVCVPRNLCARIPEGVADDPAAFGVVSAIALQGLRLAGPTLGETFVVTGLGLIGLVAVQLLRANGCRVIGIDLDGSKLDLAASYGAEVVRLDQGRDPVSAVERLTGGEGVDGVIITASSKSDEIVHQAATMCRKRGRIVLVGVVGLQLRRSDFYEKELTFQVSCSYGPGRYDPDYEQAGQDYPRGFVRWTENRNFQAVLELMRSGSLNVDALVTARYPIEDAEKAYQLLLEDRGVMGVLLQYQPGEASDTTVKLLSQPSRAAGDAPVIGAIGAGNYAGRVLLPAFKEAGARLRAIVSSGGKSGTHVGSRLGFDSSSTDPSVVLGDPRIDVVVVGTRHDSHADLVIAALEAGKHVFVEKPLALSLEDLDRISDARSSALERGQGGRLMVGFNRRFAPLMQSLKAETSSSGAPIALIYTCNAGPISADSWVHDPAVGGGRIVGEACHFIDIARYLTGAGITDAGIRTMQDPRGLGDTASLNLGFADGSIATIHYFANGDRRVPKERIEVYQDQRIYRLTNFRRLEGFGSRLKGRSRSQDKGQQGCVEAFLRVVLEGGPDPIPFKEIYDVSRVAIQLAESGRFGSGSGKWAG